MEGVLREAEELKEVVLWTLGWRVFVSFWVRLCRRVELRAVCGWCWLTTLWDYSFTFAYWEWLGVPEISSWGICSRLFNQKCQGSYHSTTTFIVWKLDTYELIPTRSNLIILHGSSGRVLPALPKSPINQYSQLLGVYLVNNPSIPIDRLHLTIRPDSLIRSWGRYILSSH